MVVSADGIFRSLQTAQCLSDSESKYKGKSERRFQNWNTILLYIPLDLVYKKALRIQKSEKNFNTILTLHGLKRNLLLPSSKQVTLMEIKVVKGGTTNGELRNKVTRAGGLRTDKGTSHRWSTFHLPARYFLLIGRYIWWLICIT